MVDYLQLMSSGGAENRNQEISTISRSLKALAKELNCPVLALSQLNRALESRLNKRPCNADLRDSGSIEQDADVILFLYRDELYDPNTLDRGIAEVIVSKQRNGPIGTVRTRFISDQTRFESLNQQGGVMNNKLTSTELQSRLLQGNFDRGRSPDERFADPLMETSMIVTLEQLHPYDLNPRLMRNPNYDDIKESIRRRGLDTPPPITRRPDQEWYIIANGGNTRLSILNELWRETHDERFWRIQCLYKPWAGTSDQPMLGELRCLIGHLAENDMHGKLSFIERALGINKARELYQQVEKCQLSQRELAEHLKNDGYPINQSHISRMEQALEYLLPCIPEVLYAGMGRSQVEKLLSLRAASLHLWQRHADGEASAFDNLFSSALSLFNDQPEDFAIGRVQDELLGLMSQQLNVDYNLLLLDVDPLSKNVRPCSAPRRNHHRTYRRKNPNHAR